MAITGMSEERRLEAVAATMREMEALARRMRELIVRQPPKDLLGYIYAQRILPLHNTEGTKEQNGEPSADELIDDTQFLLEYVHAALAATPNSDNTALDEGACAELLDLSRKLKTTALLHAMYSSAGTDNGPFGSHTADVEFRAKSAWILLRGNRYQVLEGEFYAFVLAPHDEVLRDIYGIGAAEIAAGFQDMANAVRMGQSIAFEEMSKQFEAVQVAAKTQSKPLEQVAADWMENNAAAAKAAAMAFDDMLRGGICNVSRHTSLPPVLLADLAYERGEEEDFFKEGIYSGTPFRTLPTRKKPLIKLDNDFYAVDPCFTRDSGYRALMWNLLRRNPEYTKSFNARQKNMSEAAFVEVLGSQLKGAVVYQEVYYKDPKTKQWAENDTLIVIDDVLMLVEAKAGAAATIASPALDFARHTQAVQDLVVKAYKQCSRFFDYLGSAGEVAIFKRTDDRYVECGRLRHSEFRVMLPIGLTVESFSPFSTMCKELPGVTPLLGKHAFFSLSIDELLVLKRFLPTMGELAHYMEVRQAVAGMKGAHLFDEFDHLGAYIQKNRFDQDIEEQRAKNNPDMLVWDGMSGIVDRHFEKEDWATRAVPTQRFPGEVLDLLGALDITRAPGWLSADSHVRNYGEEARNNLASILEKLRRTLDTYPNRYVLFGEAPPLFVWLQRAGKPPDTAVAKNKAIAAALAAKATSIVALFVVADPSRGYVSAERFYVEIPTERNGTNVQVYEEAERMLSRGRMITMNQQPAAAGRRLGRNERCWCGSNLKFKKCHGR